jgi:acyl carrier protein
MAILEHEQVQQTVTKFLSSHFRVNFGEVNEQTDLFQEGLIDSFGFVELVAFLEKTFSIRFDEKEFTTNSLNTVANIVATVKRKTGT